MPSVARTSLAFASDRRRVLARSGDMFAGNAPNRNVEDDIRSAIEGTMGSGRAPEIAAIEDGIPAQTRQIIYQITAIAEMGFSLFFFQRTSGDAPRLRASSRSVLRWVFADRPQALIRCPVLRGWSSLRE